jgi:hypothetical protein
MAEDQENEQNIRNGTDRKGEERKALLLYYAHS